MAIKVCQGIWMGVFLVALIAALFIKFFYIQRKGYCRGKLTGSYTVLYTIIILFFLSSSISLLQPYIPEYADKDGEQVLKCPNLMIYNQWYTSAADTLANVAFLSFGSFYIRTLRKANQNASKLMDSKALRSPSTGAFVYHGPRLLGCFKRNIFQVLFTILISVIFGEEVWQ